MKKKITLLLSVVALLACLTGCMKQERGLKLGLFGNAKVYNATSMQESFVVQTYGSAEEFYSTMRESEGLKGIFETTETVDEDGTKWFGYKAYGSNLPASGIQEGLAKAFGDDFTVTYQSTGTLIKEVTVTLTSEGDPLEGYEQYGIKDTFVIKAPLRIINSNGTPVADSANAVEWDIAPLEYGNEKQMTFTASYFNPLIPVIGCLVVIAILVIVLIIIIGKVKAKKASAATEQAAEAESTAEQAAKTESTAEMTEEEKEI